MTSRKFICPWFFLLVLTYCLEGMADSVKGEVSNFKQLEKEITKLGQLPHTLLVMDDDDTLTMMPCENIDVESQCQYLGGPAWYSWQSELIGTDSPYRVATSEAELISISTLIFSISNMAFTEPSVPDVLANLTTLGVRLLVETARGGDQVSATERQFSFLAPSLDFLSLIKINSLRMPPSGQSSLPSPYLPCDIPGSRVVSYQSGIVYLAGQNKGVQLQCLLNYYSRSQSLLPSLAIKQIVFIDDTQANVDAVYKAFRHDPNYRVLALHYTGLQKHKRALTKGSEAERLQKIAQQRWLSIKHTLDSQLVMPAI